MADKRSSGCVIAAVIGVVVLVAGVALVATLAYRGILAGKEAVSAELEKRRATDALAAAEIAAAEIAALAPVRLVDDQLPDYAAYQAGQPLTREMFLAWRVDRAATTLVRDTFREKAEGAEVTWSLRAGDLRQEGDRITGTFYLPYLIQAEAGDHAQSGVEPVRCEFARSERETLLNIRRDHTASIRGTLSLKQGETLLLNARQAGTEVEKE